MIWWEIISPRPVPLSGSFVVKKGSKIFSRFSSEIPSPASWKRIRTPEGAAIGPSGSIEIEIEPPLWLAWIAFKREIQDDLVDLIAHGRRSPGRRSTRAAGS